MIDQINHSMATISKAKFEIGLDEVGAILRRKGIFR